MLSVNNLSKKFRETTVFNKLSFDVKKGQVIGLAGLSGSGKSTLLRCIQGLEKSDSGAITCKGTIGFLFQDFQLFPHMTVAQNIIYAPLHVLRNKEAAKVAQDLLRRLNLTQISDMLPNQLSGGQKQRVALARTLAMKPDLILCDEPTSGLDIVSTRDVMQLLQSVKKMHVAMVIASHDLEFLSAISDRILIIKNGNFVADLMPDMWKKDVDVLRNYY